MLRFTDVGQGALRSELLEHDRLDHQTENTWGRRCFKSVSSQRVVILIQGLAVIFLSVAFLSQSWNHDSVRMELQRQNDMIELPGLPSVPPHKFALEHITPVKLQWLRGTCWDFATISVLEHSYRANGIAHGWLQPDMYVQFSEQALGATLMRYCKKGHSRFCMSPGDDLWMGKSTEGAETQLLYYVIELGHKILPHSVCPYTKAPGHDGVCKGMDAAVESNPIKFEVKSLATLYDRMQIKEHLISHRRAMALSVTIVASHFYLPCLPEFTSKPGMYQKACSRTCMQCPNDHAYHNLKCCAKVERPGYNMEGEFFGHDPSIDGGHAMTIVGWNDLYQTSVADVGGFIVKNSWFDGKPRDPTVWKHARGSHTMAYFMRQISGIDERDICPNTYNPRNWYPCAGQNGVTSGESTPPTSHFTFEQMVSVCTREITKLRAREERRVLQLSCLSGDYCSTEVGAKLFLINATYVPGGLHTMCFLQQLPIGSLSAFCLPPLLIDDVAMFIVPADHEIKENDRDLCGFYFYPYSLLESTNSMIGAQTNNAQGFDIQWDPSSYDRGPRLNPPGLDYRRLRNSTYVQHVRSFKGDLPTMLHPQ